MRILLDTNVVLDYLLKNEPFYLDAQQIWMAHAKGQIICSITASSLTDIYYVAHRHARRVGLAAPKPKQFARQAVQFCLTQLNIHPIDLGLLNTAFAYQGDDFEDNVQIASADAYNDSYIVTRDPKGFEFSPVAILSPVEFAKQFLKNGELK